LIHKNGGEKQKETNLENGKKCVIHQTKNSVKKIGEKVWWGI